MCQQKWLKYTDVTDEALTGMNCASVPVVRTWDWTVEQGPVVWCAWTQRHGTWRRDSCSGLQVVNKNTGAGYSPVISDHCVTVTISKTSITFKSVFFTRCRRSDSSIFVNKWNSTAAARVGSFSQQRKAAIRQLRPWPRIHVQPRFQRGFRNDVTFLRVVYMCI